MSTGRGATRCIALFPLSFVMNALKDPKTKIPNTNPRSYDAPMLSAS